LRKQARTLEHDIDKKLLLLNKLNVSIGSSNVSGGGAHWSAGGGTGDRQPLIDTATRPPHQFDTLSNDLHASIAQLTDINDQVWRVESYVGIGVV
jgi:hypothetical protein